MDARCRSVGTRPASERTRTARHSARSNTTAVEGSSRHKYDTMQSLQASLSRATHVWQSMTIDGVGMDDEELMVAVDHRGVARPRRRHLCRVETLRSGCDQEFSDPFGHHHGR